MEGRAKKGKHSDQFQLMAITIPSGAERHGPFRLRTCYTRSAMYPNPPKMAPLLVLSLMTAVLSFFAPLLVRSHGKMLGYFLFLVWIALVVFGIRKFHRKGLWLLVGTPIALLLPVVWILMYLYPHY